MNHVFRKGKRFFIVFLACYMFLLFQETKENSFAIITLTNVSYFYMTGKNIYKVCHKAISDVVKKKKSPFYFLLKNLKFSENFFQGVRNFAQKKGRNLGNSKFYSW